MTDKVLSAPMGKAVELLFYDELTDGEIAEAVGVSRRSLTRWKERKDFQEALRELLLEQGIDVTVAAISLHIRESDSGLAAASGGRPYPVMVVDDEIFVLLGDAPD